MTTTKLEIAALIRTLLGDQYDAIDALLKHHGRCHHRHGLEYVITDEHFRLSLGRRFETRVDNVLSGSALVNTFKSLGLKSYMSPDMRGFARKKFAGEMLVSVELPSLADLQRHALTASAALDAASEGGYGLVL